MFMAPFGIHCGQSKGYPFKEQDHKETLAEWTVSDGLSIITGLRENDKNIQADISEFYTIEVKGFLTVTLVCSMYTCNLYTTYIRFFYIYAPSHSHVFNACIAEHLIEASHLSRY